MLSMMKDATGCGNTDQMAGCKDLPPKGLRRRALVEAGTHLVVLFLFFGAFGRMFSEVRAAWAGVLAGIVLAAIHGYAWHRLADNRPAGAGGIGSRLGAANRLTLLRGLLVSLTAGFLLFPPGVGRSAVLAWLPGVFYLAASLMDGLDGVLARRTGTDNPLGKALDGHVDALGVLVASSVAVAAGRLPVYYLSAGLAHYIYRFGLRRRRRLGKTNHPEPSRQFARLVAGFQMGFLGTALLPFFSAVVLKIAAPVFLLPLLAGFVWDWLHVRGTLSDRQDRRCRALVAALAHKGPPVLRGVLLAAGIGRLLTASLPLVSLGGLVELGLLLLVVVGFVGRSGAFLLSLLLAMEATFVGTSPLLGVMLVSSLILMQTGTGAGSLWRPEDARLWKRPGVDDPGR